MKKIDTVKQAIQFLRGKGCTVDRYNKVYMVSWTTDTKPYPYTPRGLIKFAKGLSENIMPWGKSLKEERRDNNRAATKADISKQAWDNFDKNKLRKDGNPFNWN